MSKAQKNFDPSKMIGEEVKLVQSGPIKISIGKYTYLTQNVLLQGLKPPKTENGVILGGNDIIVGSWDPDNVTNP